MRPIFTNNARAFLDGAITDTDTEIVVGNGSSFPDPGEGEYFACTLESNDGSREIIYVGSRTNNTFSDVERGQEGTTAQSWSSGDTASHRLTAETYSDFIQNADLAANGGTVPEVGRENEFSEIQRFVRDGASQIEFQRNNDQKKWRITQNLFGNDELTFRDQDEGNEVLEIHPNGVAADGADPKGLGTANFVELYEDGTRVLTDDSLADNGGTVPEVDRENVFALGQTFGNGSLDDGQALLFLDAHRDFSLRRHGESSSTANLAFTQEVGGNEWSFTFDSGDEIREFAIFGNSSNVFLIGARVGKPSSGYKGHGTLNAEELYEDGNRVVTDYVFDAELDGDVDTAHYDALMGEREIDEGEDEDGNPKVRREKQIHRPAHAFRENASELEPTEFAKRWRQSRKLPAMERCESSLCEGQDRPSLGQTLQAVLETCEVQAVHIDRLEKRVRQLEAAREIEE